VLLAGLLAPFEPLLPFEVVLILVAGGRRAPLFLLIEILVERAGALRLAPVFFVQKINGALASLGGAAGFGFPTGQVIPELFAGADVVILGAGKARGQEAQDQKKAEYSHASLIGGAGDFY
jgi:hypothetical protein